MVILEWIIYIALALTALPYVVGPPLVWLSQTMPEAYRFALLDTEAFLAERSDTFLALHKQISASGFHYIGSSELAMSHSSMAFSIYFNPESLLCCTLSSAYSEPMNTTQIEFTQLFEDGSVVNINNNPLFNIYPDWDKKIGYRFPQVNDFDQLLSIASALIAAHQTTSSKSGLEQGREFAVIEQHLNSEMQRLIDTGYVSPTVHQGKRRLTIKGALLFTWKLCWPIKGWLARRDEIFSRKALLSTQNT